MAPSSSSVTPAIHSASSPAHQPVIQRQMSSNNNSRPTTPQTARSREPRQRKDQSPHPSASNKNATNTSTDVTTIQPIMEARSKPNKPLPTASQLKQLENADSSSERPRGVITLPTTTTTKRDPVESPRPRNARAGRNQPQEAAGTEGSGSGRTPKLNDKRKSRSRVHNIEVGQPQFVTGGVDTEDDVFSARKATTAAAASSPFGRLDSTPSNARPDRRPRHARTVSEPFSVMSGTAGDNHSTTHGSKLSQSQKASRRKRREKDKDKGRAGPGLPAEALAPALGELNIQAGHTGSQGTGGALGKRTGLRFPLEEEDDSDSSISSFPAEAGDGDGGDDSGTGFDSTAPLPNLSEPQPRAVQDHPRDAGTRLLNELRLLSQSAPGGKSFLSSGRQPQTDEDCGSASGYGSGNAGGGMRSGRPKREDRLKGTRGRASAEGQVGDESAVWEMPDLQERGSGTDLTWQQSLLASPAANMRAPASRRAKEGKPTTPSASSGATKRAPSTRLTQGFTPSRQQIRDNETFGTTSSSTHLRSEPSGFSTPQRNMQRQQEYGGQRPVPYHTVSAPANALGNVEHGKRSVVEDIKVYAGPTFHNSPSADSLPAPRMKGV